MKKKKVLFVTTVDSIKAEKLGLAVVTADYWWSRIKNMIRKSLKAILWRSSFFEANGVER